MIIGIGVSKKHRTMSFCIKKDALFFLFLRRGAEREGLVHTKQRSGGWWWGGREEKEKIEKEKKTRMNKSINRWRMQDKEAKKRRRKKQAQRPFLKKSRSGSYARRRDDWRPASLPGARMLTEKGDWCESPVYVRMHVCLYCMCVRVCVLMMKRLPLVWDSGRATNAKIRKRERKATESGDGRFLLRAAMDEGRIDARGMGDGRDGYFLDSNFFWREARKRRRGRRRGGKRERRNQGSQSASAPKWVRIFFPLFSLREMVSIEI